MHKEYDKLTPREQLLVRAMFHPTKGGYEAYTYELSKGGWIISRRKRLAKRQT